MTKPRSRTPLVTTVETVEWISAGMVRITAVGGELSRFQLGAFTDSYVKVMFLNPAASYQRPIDVEAIRASHPSENWPRLRTYTVRDWDPERLALTLDFVVHGTQGRAGPWAAAARPGDELLLLGPGGGYTPDPAAGWHLLAGDESALPAIAATLAALDQHATVLAFIEVHGAEDELPLQAPAGARIHWLHRGELPFGDRLVPALEAADWPDGVPQVFVHGEAGMVKRLRMLLKVERGIPPERLSISGYWRLGSDDEGWRAAKADWNRGVELAEAAAGA